jgi:hypothetical protein
MPEHCMKPWVARVWAGPRAVSEARYAEAWEAQDSLEQHPIRAYRVSIDYEPRARPKGVRNDQDGCSTEGKEDRNEHP